MPDDTEEARALLYLADRAGPEARPAVRRWVQRMASALGYDLALAEMPDMDCTPLDWIDLDDQLAGAARYSDGRPWWPDEGADRAR